MSMFWITEKLEMLFLPLVIKLKFTVFIVFGGGGKVSYFERKEQSNKQTEIFTGLRVQNSRCYKTGYFEIFPGKHASGPS